MARSKPIQNPKQLLENMVLVRDILISNNVKCFLHFGTLLGAIREKNFIPHDDDADLGVFISDFDKVVTLLPLFISYGFEFNSQRLGRLLQFIRNDEQVDIFFVSPTKRLFFKMWAIDERTTVPYKFLSDFETINFLGYDFLIPKKPERLMKNLYGRTWQIPLKNIPSRTNLSWRLKKLFLHPEKCFYFLFRFINTQKRKYFTNSK
jgi:hypothetical protein